ncbi:SulP family inorganic anion transporter [Marinomonas posidonica]|uniref:Sulfate transporter n=1 Tax=Marinomonas posidonica (strain CECT 7376 / NCIMB 14433 / IVIA-Po-181) TaxID=491952 RepID=F6CXF9_MARPP|nr:sulfate permease [Marinomonas posidonica]AEF55575.1 sulfate transporter [Marinomonas posidonica IVIA-Po-181]
MKTLDRGLPAMAWLRQYSHKDLATDGMASFIATILLIPQSMGYAILAGLPAYLGLYASILPSIVYSLLGTSRSLAVGPVAITSMMTATVILPLAMPGSDAYVSLAILLAFVSGVFLVLMSLLKMGFLTNLLSHPVISGFISASAILIAVGQLKHLLGIQAHGNNLIELIQDMLSHADEINLPTFIISSLVIGLLVFFKQYLSKILKALGLSSETANLLSKAGPVLVVVLTTVCVALLSLDQQGIKIVGHIQLAWPSIDLTNIETDTLWSLLPGAFLISVVGFVGSVSVAQSFAAKRKEDIQPNQELLGLGTANIASALSGAFPVTGGFSRTVVNTSAGAKTPMAGILTALFMLLVLFFLTPLFYYLPNAVLAASIIVAILQLVDIKDFIRLYHFSKQEALALAATFLVVLFVGMETGIIVGISLSLLFFLWHTSHPHIAVVGRVPGTEHFRNVQRYQVETTPDIVTIRIDENLFFANARVLEDYVLSLIAQQKDVKHVVLMCSAVNMIDASALDSLEAISERLNSAGVTLHFSEIKGPVMDKLRQATLITNLTGQIFLTQHQAMQALSHPVEAQNQGE